MLGLIQPIGRWPAVFSRMSRHFFMVASSCSGVRLFIGWSCSQAWPATSWPDLVICPTASKISQQRPLTPNVPLMLCSLSKLIRR